MAKKWIAFNLSNYGFVPPIWYSRHIGAVLPKSIRFYKEARYLIAADRSNDAQSQIRQISLRVDFYDRDGCGTRSPSPLDP